MDKQAVQALGHRELFVRLLGTTPGNLSRFYRRRTLAPAQSEALLDVLRVFVRAASVFGSRERGNEWLATLVPALGDQRPDDTSMDRWPVSVLPPDWRDFPYPKSTRRMGTDWLIRGDGHLLAVPSAAVPAGLESTVLVNPVRLGAGTIRLIGRQSLTGNSDNCQWRFCRQYCTFLS